MSRVKRKNQKSFTLIELMVVISIIGLISSIVLVAVNSARERARIAAGLQFASSVHHALGAEAVGIWDFDEGSGTTARDFSGYNNHGTINGATWVSGQDNTPSGKGYALNFNGANNYVNIPIISYAPNAFTMAAWVYLNGPSSGGIGAAIVGTLNSGYDGDIGVTAEANPRIYVHTCCTNGQQFAYYNNTKTGTWYHVAGTYDGASTMKLYINKWKT